METVWHEVRGKLSIASGDDFERTALHYLRILWPTLIQSPRLQQLDRYGVDLCVPESDSHFAVVIQAKGFKVAEELIKSQVTDQILPSIQKFLGSPLSCDHYVLLHNRDGSERTLAALIQEKLDGLIQAGKAKHVQLWDRDIFIKEIRNRLETHIRAKLAERSQHLLQQHSQFFHFGNLFVSQVPLRQFGWKPDQPFPKEFVDGEFVDADIARLIASPRDVRYSLLIGSFGLGKTTATLRAAGTHGLLIIYVPAHTIVRQHGGYGTNALLRNFDTELNLLDDFLPDTAEVLKYLIGAALGRLLRKADDQYALVIDGLDEHAFYGTVQGLQWLTNELADLRCPIVLTTRREHFLSRIGDYELAADTLSKKNGARRTIEILELGAWTHTQAHELLERAIERLDNATQISDVRRLRVQLDSSSSRLSANLLNHPLFLQMTLDLIVEGEDWLFEDEDRLIEVWIHKKIKRDLRLPRLKENWSIDVECFVAGMVEAMVQVAIEMHRSEFTPQETDTMPVDRVLAIVREAVGIPELDATTMLTTSLLVPVNRRQGKLMPVKFFHRSIQEYLVRRHLA